MAYQDLTVEEKASLDDFVNNLRALCGQLSRTCNTGQAMSDGYNATIAPIMAKLAAGDVIPNHSGLAGAVDLTKTQVMAQVTDFAAILTAYNVEAKRQARAAACGWINTIG